jgi:uncharacterized protein (DUF885 family)
MGFFSSTKKKQNAAVEPVKPAASVKPQSATTRRSTKSAQSKVDAMNALMDKYWADYLETNPTDATYLGKHNFDDRLKDLSEEAVAASIHYCEETLAKLNHIGDNNGLAGWTANDVITYKVHKENLESSITSDKLGGYFLRHSSMWGFLSDLPTLVSKMDFTNQADYDKFLARMNALPNHVDQLIARLKLGMGKGITPARISVLGCDEQIRGMATQNPSRLAAPLETFDAVCPDASKLKADIEKTLSSAVPKALGKLADFVRDEYIPGCGEEISIVKRLPNGEEMYAYLLEQSTSTKMTAQEIHDVGQSEVKRILAEMTAIAHGEGFTGEDGLAKYVEHLNNDPQYVAGSVEELINHYRVACMVISPNLSKLFGKLPRTTFGVRPIPEYRAESAPGAYYESPPEDGSLPGYFYANCSHLESRKLFTVDALVLHEGIPGHHMQIALALENKDLPMIRRVPSYTAYIEGWGLYSENQGTDLGLYLTSASRYGKLSMEMLRACRLVTDTGMHALGWTKKQAMDFGLANNAGNFQELDAETTRYLSIPGQATAYKIGELKFQELRQRATEKLGYAFDIRKFHDLVLEGGAVPLTVLEEIVDSWIQSLTM